MPALNYRFLFRNGRIFGVPDEPLNKSICDLLIRHADKALASVVTLLNVARKPVIYRGRPRKCAFFDSFSNGCEARCEVGNVLGSVYRKFAALLLAPLRLIFSPFLDLATFPISERHLDIMPADQQIKTCFSKCDRCFLPWKP